MEPLKALTQPSGLRDTLLDILRTPFRRRRMPDHMKATQQSLVYRRKAAELARLVEAELDEDEMLSLLHQALGWIQPAENEELLGEDGRSGEEGPRAG